MLLVSQPNFLTLVFALPEPRSLEDLFYQLLKGTLDAIFGLCTGLCVREEFKRSVNKVNVSIFQHATKTKHISQLTNMTNKV